jgi:putative membrane protein
MTASVSQGAYGGVAADERHEFDTRFWVFAGFAILLSMVALMVVLSIVLPTRFGFGMMNNLAGSWGWMWGLVGLLFVVLVLGWVFRVALWGVAPSNVGYGYFRRWRPDGASAIVRTRYARGEITRDQYEQMLRELGY